MNDIEEIKRSYVNNPNLNLIALVDRRPDFSHYSNIKIPHWQIQSWYNSIDTVASGLNNPYGKLSWYKDGQDSKKIQWEIGLSF